MCVFHLHSRVCLEPWLQIWVQAAGAWGALCTCCTEVGGWVSRLGSCDVQESCLALLLREMVNLPSSISFTTECMSTKNAGALPGYCWYCWKQLITLFSQLQFRMEISLSWTLKDRGLCFTCFGHFFPFVVHSPLFKLIKAVNSIKYISFLRISAWTCLQPNFPSPPN